MLLYHGTSIENWNKIKKSGFIMPRSKSKAQLARPGEPESSKEFVYLSDCYAHHYAFMTSKNESVILEVNVDEYDLYPDEDFLQEVNKEGAKFLSDEYIEDSRKRTIWFSKRIKDYKYYWDKSLSMLGTVAHLGSISLHNVSRIVTIDKQKQQKLIFDTDPSICILNNKYLGAKYRSMLKWIFDEDCDIEQSPIGLNFNPSKYNRLGINVMENEFV